MKKKLLVGILVLTMLVACLGITASAAAAAPEEVKITEGTAAELEKAIKDVRDGGKITLEADVTDITSMIKIEDNAKASVGKSITIDLNGHDITGKVDAANGLFWFKNSSGTADKTITITDSQTGREGTIKNTGTGCVIYLQGGEGKKANLVINAAVTLIGGTTINTNSHANVTISKGTIKGTTPLKITSGAGLTITDGTIYGVSSIDPASSSINPTRSITGGLFSNYSSLTNGLAKGYGLIDVETDDQGVNLYKIGQVSALAGTAEAKVQLTDSSDSVVYGTLQQLVELYKGRGKTFEVINNSNATLTLKDYGGTNSGVFTEANTLTIKVNDGSKLTLTATGTKVAKFVFDVTDVTNITKTITAANGYAAKTTEDKKTTTCDVDPNSVDVIAEVTVSGQPTKYLTAETIKSFLLKGLTENLEATITFKHDYKLPVVIDIPKGANITIDMGGFTLTSNIAKGGMALKSLNGGKVTLKNGTFDASLPGVAISLGVTASSNTPGVAAKPDYDSHGEAIIAEDAVVKGTIGVFNSGSKLTVSGTVEAEGFAIAGNGAHDGTEITIKDGASVTSETTAAVYHPQNGTLTIGDGDSTKAPHIEGMAGVVVRDGTVKVNDADIVANGTTALKVGDAANTVPAGGIVVDNAAYGTPESMDVVIDNATVETAGSQPAVSYTEKGEPPKTMPTTPEITVNGGTYSNAPDSSFLGSSLKASVTESDGTVSYFNSPAAAEQYAEENGGQVDKVTVKNPTDTAYLAAVGFIPAGTSHEDAVAMVKAAALAAGVEAKDIAVPTEIDAGSFFAVVVGSKADQDSTYGGNYKVEFGKSGVSGTESVNAIGVKKCTIVCYKPTNAATEGKYTMTLKTTTGADGINDASVNVYKIHYVGTTGVSQSKEYIIYTIKAGVDAALKDVPPVFTLDAGVNKWTTGIKYPDKGEYVYTVTIGGVYSAPIDPEHKCPTKGFKDMELLDTTKLWYHEAMDYMVLNGYIKGFDGANGVKNLQPNGIATRAQMLVIMAQIKGTMIEGKDPWYGPAIEWAQKYNYSDGLRPNDAIQREEIVTILWRMAGEPKADAKYIEDYPDVASVNDWAKTAMAWAVEKGIMGGRVDEKTGKDVLVPQGIGNRAELAMLIYNYVTLMK